jgi:uncharacterized protein
MILTGKATINAPNLAVWGAFMDTDTLARLIPFVKHLEKINDEDYKSIFEIKMGPVGGSFTGTFKMIDVVAPDTFKLVIQQNGAMGNAYAVVTINISSLAEAQTLVTYSGDVRLSGTLAIMGGRVLTPIANMLSKQFFDALSKELTN